MKNRFKLATVGIGIVMFSLPMSADNYRRGYSNYGHQNDRDHFGSEYRSRDRHDRRQIGGIDGVRTVFFPEPVNRFGEPIRSRRGNATRFCRDLGLGEASHATSSNGYVVDILCRRR